MTVNSFIELYLTVFGWILYDGFWSILTDTGIAYIPFIGALVRNFAEPYTSQNERDASVTSIKRMEVDVFTMLTVIVLAGQPALPVSVSGTNYTPACSVSGARNTTAVSGGATGTTYDTAFSATALGNQSAVVPIWWIGVMRLSTGVANAAIQSIPCAVDLRQLRYELDNERIVDPETLRQVWLFVNDCWAPARAYFDTSHDTLTAGTDPSDINWLGSTHFLSAGYYDRYQARRAVPGFSFQATALPNGLARGRDSVYYNTSLPKPQWGHPLCREWWTEPQNGLRARILSGIPPALLTDIITAMAAQGLSQRQTEDWIVRDQIAGATASSPVRISPEIEPSVLSNPANLAGAIGAKLEQFTLLPKIYLLKQAAPVIQSLLLMLLYAALPFILLFSSYSIATVISTSIILFSIKFLSVFWELARWLDTHLQEAITLGRVNNDFIDAYNYFIGSGALDSVREDLLDLALAVMFVVAPLVWVFALGLAGINVGKGIGIFVDNATKPVASAGEGGGRTLTNAGKKGVSKLGK